MTQKHSAGFLPLFKGSGLVGMLFFFAFFFIVPVSRSQSYFYFENKLPGDNNARIIHHSFLILDGDGTGIARVWYQNPASGDTNRFEILLADSIQADLQSSDDIKYLVPIGSPVLLKGNMDSGFTLPRFIFKKQVLGTESFYILSHAEYKVRGGNWIAVDMSVNQEKSLDDLTNQPKPLLAFYKQDEDFFKYVIKPGSRGGPSGIIRKEKLFLIVVANTNDTSIGLSSKKDFENISSTFTGLAKDLGMEIIPTYISGDGFSKNAVETALSKRNLKPSPIDIVVFYYSGHGFRYADDTSKYPRISLRSSAKQKRSQNNLRIEEIYQHIVKLGARVNIVLSDCCNENVGVVRPEGKDILEPRGSDTWPGKLNMENCNALLFPEQPVSILVGSAEINQYASGNPRIGGFFTSFFKTELHKSLYGYQSGSSWKTLLSVAKEKARYQALTALCGSARCVQRAEIRIVPEQ